MCIVIKCKICVGITDHKFAILVGMDMLTNIQKGHLYGEMCGWRMGKRRLMGVHLLHKSFQTYNLNTPQEIFMDDI